MKRANRFSPQHCILSHKSIVAYPFRIYLDKGVEPVIQSRNLLQMRLHQFHRR
jgi:hypothetical protein